eukprot:GHVT01002683.1.p2 GENE.GHVT01002683.1~~GHVT01002683.1.p2  ORF type:complete len:113 (-),score=32.64 GHVT01002683.1:105-443(-)
MFDATVVALCTLLLLCSKEMWSTLARRSGGPSLEQSAPEALDSSAEDVEDLLQQSLSAFRFGMQLVRMVPLARQQRRAQVGELQRVLQSTRRTFDHTWPPTGALPQAWSRLA